MTNSLPCQDWVQTIKTEYLDDFIREGGSAIKFAVPVDAGARPVLFTQLTHAAHDGNYLTAQVDASLTRVHMAHEVFFRIAEQIEWRSIARQVVRQLARECDYDMPEDDGGGPLRAEIAERNEIDPGMVIRVLRPRLSDQVFRHPGLAKDFRVAMTNLCEAELSGGPEGEGTTTDVLTSWLTGRNRRIGPVKPYGIFNTITRTNARHMFESLLNWIRFAGYPGLLVLLDISRVTLNRRVGDGSLYYTRAAVLDAYEVLRQFIDAIERLQGCLIVVSPDVEFLSEEPRERGFGAYDALKFRVVDEIHDRRLVNPMSSLVRLSADA